jgi:predicted PurR-regulated permease PerM
VSDSLRARKKADLLSVTGAAVAGLAVGAWLADAIRPVFLPMLIAGLFAHAVGMTARHRLDRKSGALPAVWQWLYGLCWIAIAAVPVLGVWLWLGSGRS